MAFVYIANALVGICLALFGAALCQDPSGQVCALTKPCSCSGTKVDCKKRGLKTIPEGIPQTTTDLDLSSNELTTLDLPKLSRLSNLQELLLHENQLKEAPPWQALPSSLRRLSLHHNKISVIPSQNVTKRMSLQYLFLNSNRISTIEPNAFANLTSVQSLKLSRNKLLSIPVAALSQLTSLRKLDLTKNLIRAVDVPLKSLKTVTALKLSKNKISSILRSSFWEMSSLKELNLDNNNLTSVSTVWFFGVSNLQKLSLNSNRIRAIETSKVGLNWRSVLLLRELYLARNELWYIDATSFAHLSNLKRLGLGSNSIYHLANGAFSDLHSLQMLDLSNNALSSTLESEVFAKLEELKLLRLDGNRITWIAANTFTGLTAVSSLNLSANIISSIDKDAFLEMKNLQYLFLNTDSLVCDCKLSWLPFWLRRKRLKPRALCLYPLHLTSRSIFNLTSSDFVCDANDSKPEVIEHPRGRKVLLGQNMTLQCMVSPKNHSITVNWTKNYKPLTRGFVTVSQSKDGNLATYSSELHLSSVSRRDNGFYQCVAYSAQLAPVQSKMAQITVLVFPKLTKKPENVFVEAGKTIQLHCKAQGHPIPTLSWQKDGGASFPAADDRRILYNDGSEVCEIKNATYVDTGKYTCSATNEAGSVNASAFVTVLEPPRFVRSLKREITVSIGDSMVLECFVRGAPKPSVAWFKDGNEVKSSEHVVIAEAGQLLAIAQVKDEDEGSYACEASNSQGNVKRTMEVTIETEKYTSVAKSDKFNSSKYVKYDKKTFLGIIVVAVVASIVVTSMVWLFIQYNTLSCGKKRSPRRSQFTGPFGADCSDESNSRAFNQEISYIPLKLSSSSSTQTSRESPRSTATFLTASEAAQGRCTVATLAASSSENASGSEEKSSGNDNISSENSLKGSHSSLASSCPSESCLPSYQEVVTSAQIHASDSDSEKNRAAPTKAARKNSLSNHDPGGGMCEPELDIPDCIPYNEETCLTYDGNDLPKDVTPDVCVTVYPLTKIDTSCVTDGLESVAIET